jgi:hypothetical protein
MEPEGSLPHSPQPYPEPDHSSPYPSHSHYLKIHINIILPSTPGSPQWSLSLRFSQNPVHSYALHAWFLRRTSAVFLSHFPRCLDQHFPTFVSRRIPDTSQFHTSQKTLCVFTKNNLLMLCRKIITNILVISWSWQIRSWQSRLPQGL